MGWEERNGSWYYYRKKRINGTVQSEYVGSGPFAEALSRLDQIEQEKRREKAYRRKLKREEMQEEIRMVEEARRVARQVRDAALLASGYHNHKGTWRKRHGNESQSPNEKAGPAHAQNDHEESRS